MRRLIRLIPCAFVLHNLHIYKPIPEEWKEEVKQHGNELNEDGELNQPVSRNVEDEERRKQPLQHLLEVRGGERE